VAVDERIAADGFSELLCTLKASADVTR